MINLNPLLVRTDQQGMCTLTLNRPERHNAFDADFIQALVANLELIDKDPSVRVLVVTGSGESFCSGADLQWMGDSAVLDEEANRQDAEQLAALMRVLYRLRKPTIARVNGPAYGGGLGLICCCDIAIASKKACFAFSEVKLGLIPAVISPYVINAIGSRQARRLFLTGERIDANQAQSLGLVHQAVGAKALDEAVAKQVSLLLKGGPMAQAQCKRLIQRLTDTELDATLAAWIASVRSSTEGRAGLKAFLDKKKPPWIKD